MTKTKTTHTPGQCRECRQGYTKEGNAAYPDHIELCSLHTTASELVNLLKAILPFISIAGHQINGRPAFDVVKEALSRAEASDNE